MLPLTGSADDGKRSSLDVTFVRGFQRGITQLTPSGYPKPVGSADDGKRPSLDVTFTRGVQGGKLNLPLRGTPASTGRRIWPAGGRLP